jgi:hypothetical protein
MSLVTLTIGVKSTIQPTYIYGNLDNWTIPKSYDWYYIRIQFQIKKVIYTYTLYMESQSHEEIKSQSHEEKTVGRFNSKLGSKFRRNSGSGPFSRIFGSRVAGIIFLDFAFFLTFLIKETEMRHRCDIDVTVVSSIT